MDGPKFRPGRTLATPGALEALREAGQQPAEFLDRHLGGDWGELDEHDSEINDRALASGEGRIVSAYRTSVGGKLWCITERDRSATTLTLPDEY